MSSSKVPPPCDPEVFKSGKPLLAVDTYTCGASGFEDWVRSIAQESGQRVDWHYSGGIAQVLYIGDRQKLVEAMKKIPCVGCIMRMFEEGTTGLYRKDVTPTPPGAIAGFYDGGSGSVFITEEKPDDK